MAQSPAEKQSLYRARHKNDFRLEVRVSKQCSEALNALSEYHKLLKKELVEKLILDAAKKIIPK